jgi:hypothetical protein
LESRAESVYKEFKNKMDSISAGDLSALEEMFGLASDCLSDKTTSKIASSLPDFDLLRKYGKTFLNMPNPILPRQAKKMVRLPRITVFL